MKTNASTIVRSRWTDVCVSSSLVLAVSVPVLVVEEDWHGLPMIDQPTHLWIVGVCLVVIAFLVGGATAGYRRPYSAAQNAAISASLSVAVLLGAALFRRLALMHSGTPKGVVLLWYVSGAAAIGISAAGSLVGRRWKYAHDPR